MGTYVILNLIVIGIVLAGLGIRVHWPSNAWLATLGSLIILTLVFDNLLIALEVYSYAPSKILGIHVGLAPIEDFMYALLAAILIPAVWNRLGTRNAERQ